MKICKYCNSLMIGENETQRDGSYYFFYVCQKCKSIYEGKRDKKNTLLESRWYNSEKNEFEN